jgi:hypothetical protein
MCGVHPTDGSAEEPSSKNPDLVLNLTASFPRKRHVLTNIALGRCVYALKTLFPELAMNPPIWRECVDVPSTEGWRLIALRRPRSELDKAPVEHHPLENESYQTGRTPARLWSSHSRQLHV